jgi:cellulose biosynthesis protein BcsQ
METPLPKQGNGRIVAVSQQKAASAKTKTSISLGEACARWGLRIRAVDIEGQGNATTSGS